MEKLAVLCIRKQQQQILRVITFFLRSPTNYFKPCLHLFPAQQLLVAVLKESDLGFCACGCDVQEEGRVLVGEVF